MLKRLRIKIVCITMAISVLMLCVIFVLMVQSTSRDLETQSVQLLRQVMEEPVKPVPPGSRTVLPYFVLRQTAVGDLVVGAGESYYHLEDAAFLRQVVTLVENTGKQTGLLSEYSLRFACRQDPMGKTFAFVDISAHTAAIQGLKVTCTVVGIGCFLVLLLACILLAKWVTRPVQRAWDEQRQFVADASHELKTPLTVITTNLELLSQTREDDPRRWQFLENIRAMSIQMRSLAEGMLELARVDNGALRTTFTPVQLSEAIGSTVLTFEAMFFEAGLQLESNIQPDLQVMGSQQHLVQVVEILLDNACKYSTPNSTVWIWLRKSGPRECVLGVSGYGEALSAEELKQIFQRFYRVDKARSRGGSYGLGLSIAQAIVSDHKGKIWAQSEKGRNTFFVKLPLL